MYTRSIYVAAAAAAARVFATPWRACTCACAPLRIRVDPHTRVQPDRACLCGDPNEGRQASKLGRAAAARAAILLESGWKTSGAADRAPIAVFKRTSARLRRFVSETEGGEGQVGAGCHVTGGEGRINTWSGVRWRGRVGGREGERETIVR